MCGAAALAPSWDRLTDRDQLIGFMEKLKRAGVGPEGQLDKLEAITSTLKHYNTHSLLKDATFPELAKTVTNVEGRVAVCNVTLEELKATKLVSQENKTVVTVVEHITGREGHTKLLGIDYQRLQQYLKCVRLLQDPCHTRL